MNQKSKKIRCVRDLNGVVLDQNPCSLRECGRRIGSVCQDRCGEFVSLGETSRPVVKKRKLLDGKYYDILVFQEDGCIHTHLFPLMIGSGDARERMESADLTPREREVAELMLKGHSNRQICQRLFISEPTLKSHINRIYRKLGGRGKFALRG